MSDSADKPKIIVDEDWKAQVEAEREATAHSQPSETPSAPGSTGGSKPAETSDVALPPASLPFLLSTIATQAMITLGQLPNPFTGKADVHLQQAKHHIDTLSMLQEKTAGNRTPEETAMLDELLHQLRIAYVMMLNAPSSAGERAESRAAGPE